MLNQTKQKLIRDSGSLVKIGAGEYVIAGAPSRSYWAEEPTHALLVNKLGAPHNGRVAWLSLVEGEFIILWSDNIIKGRGNASKMDST